MGRLLQGSSELDRARPRVGIGAPESEASEDDSSASGRLRELPGSPLDGERHGGWTADASGRFGFKRHGNRIRWVFLTPHRSAPGIMAAVLPTTNPTKLLVVMDDRADAEPMKNERAWEPAAAGSSVVPRVIHAKGSAAVRQSCPLRRRMRRNTGNRGASSQDYCSKYSDPTSHGCPRFLERDRARPLIGILAASVVARELHRSAARRVGEPPGPADNRKMYPVTEPGRTWACECEIAEAQVHGNGISLVQCVGERCLTVPSATILVAGHRTLLRTTADERSRARPTKGEQAAGAASQGEIPGIACVEGSAARLERGLHALQMGRNTRDRGASHECHHGDR